MGRVAKVLAVLLLTALLALGFYAYIAYRAAQSVEYSFADVKGLSALLRGENRFAIVLNVSVPEQPLPVTICVDELHGRVFADGSEIAEFESRESFCIDSGSWRLVDIDVEVNEVGVLKSLVSALLRGSVTLEVRGEAFSPLALDGLILPIRVHAAFDVKREVSLARAVEEAAGIAPGYRGEKLLSIRVEWVCGGAPCPGTVEPGTPVKAVVYLEGSAEDVVVRVKQDRRMLPDKIIVEKRLGSVDGSARVELSFVAEGGLLVRGYFVEVEWWGGKWVMPHEQRLRVS